MKSKTLNLAALDIETLSLENNAVVYELGIVTMQLSVETSPTVQPPYNSHIVNFHILPQVLEGRSVSVDTVKFHEKLARKRGLNTSSNTEDFDYYFGQSSNHLAHPPESITEQVRSILTGADEVWINHPEFDLPNLNSLLKVTTDKPLFHYRKVRDVSMARNSGLGIFQPEGESAHKSVLYALWNLRIASAWHSRIAFLLSMEEACNERKTQEATNRPLNENPSKKSKVSTGKKEKSLVRQPRVFHRVKDLS